FVVLLSSPTRGAHRTTPAPVSHAVELRKLAPPPGRRSAGRRAGAAAAFVVAAAVAPRPVAFWRKVATRCAMKVRLSPPFTRPGDGAGAGAGAGTGVGAIGTFPTRPLTTRSA